MYLLLTRMGYDLEHAFRSSIFQVVTFITTTGMFSDNAALWPHVTWVVLAVCMFFGACSGSTSGGIKCIRGVMILRIIRNEFRQILHPNAVLPLKVDGTNVPNQKRVTLLAFIAVYLILALVISFTMIAIGIDNTNAITITLSCLGNVGPTLGIEIGPTMSWSSLPMLCKWLCAMMMLIGRLEIFTVLVIFTPAFWKEN
jgi:trk system potassium uptake protein TrkH